MKEFEAKKQKIIIHIEELQRCDRLQEKVQDLKREVFEDGIVIYSAIIRQELRA